MALQKSFEAPTGADAEEGYLESPFSVEAMNKKNANYLSVGYTFLKTQPLLLNAEDV